MTKDEAIYVLKNAAWLGAEEQAEKVSEAVRMAVDALKAQLPKEDTTSDCISRQEAIRIASGYCHFTNVAKELAKLPSVQPEVLACGSGELNVQSEPHWIPCSETVDIPDHEILACDKYGKEMFGYLAYEDDQWLCVSDNCMMYDPIAWREKPESYRGRR